MSVTFSRRHMVIFPSVLAATDPRTIVNSVLSGYGLPTVGNAKGFTPYDNFGSNYEFQYPKSWVVRCVLSALGTQDLASARYTWALVMSSA